MTKGEARVLHLQKDLVRLNMWDALRALNLMISTMNSINGYSRKDGSNYYYHLVDATQDLINHGIVDEATITACILHDAVEDIEEIKIEDIEKEYGYEVADIVSLVTKKEGVNYKDEDGVNISLYLSAILRNPKACLVKLADRKHNFSTLDSTSTEHELRQVKETEKYFIPFAKEARKQYPHHSAYFHSFKTTIIPHLKRIKKAFDNEYKLKLEIAHLQNQIKKLEEKLGMR